MNERKPHIAVLLGTARTGRNSEAVARYITDTISADGRADAVLYDVRDYLQDRTIPDWQPDGEAEQTTAWRAVASKADAFIMVLPEYNHGYPGEWKMVIDQDGVNYRGKPVITAGVSRGPFMGARVVEHVIPVYTELGMVYVPYPLYFGSVGDFVAADAAARDDQYTQRVIKSLDKLLLFEKHLHGIQKELIK